MGTHWIFSYVSVNNILFFDSLGVEHNPEEIKKFIGNKNGFIVNVNNIFFDSFGVEHIPEEIKKFIGNKNIITNIYRIQAYDSIMCGYFCIAVIDFLLEGKVCLIIQIYFLLMIMRRMIK